MKFSAAVIFGLATGAIAMPWSTNSRGSHEDITSVPQLAFNLVTVLHVKVSQSPARAALTKHDICWLLCASESINCPEGWYSSQQGECWTCCRGTGDLGL